jgi:hypothetical protein
MASMISNFHFSEMQAWSMPLAKARAYQAWWIMAHFPAQLVTDGYLAQEAATGLKSQISNLKSHAR